MPVEISVHHGDMREIVGSLADASVDLILTDPPYGETSLEWDRWVTGWPTLVRRLLKPTASMWVFGSMRMFFDHVDEFDGWKLAQDIVWEKHNGSGFHADRFKRVHEHALHFYRDDVAWGEVYKAPQFTHDAVARSVMRKKHRPYHMGNREQSSYTSEDGGPRLMRSVIYARSEHGRADHPTQKPLAIVEPLLLYSCPPGGMVLDCFAGSGTTGIAARRHGMSAILIEGKAEYHAAIDRRLGSEATLFDGAA